MPFVGLQLQVTCLEHPQNITSSGYSQHKDVSIPTYKLIIPTQSNLLVHLLVQVHVHALLGQDLHSPSLDFSVDKQITLTLE